MLRSLILIAPPRGGRPQPVADVPAHSSASVPQISLNEFTAARIISKSYSQ